MHSPFSKPGLHIKLVGLALMITLLLSVSARGTNPGTWTALRDTAPNLNNGVMLLLTDGSVITITTDDPLAVYDDSAGPVWNKLVPDSTGSYVNGKWSLIAPMHNSRIYFSTQVLQNGKVYAAGGEFGTGGAAAELYDPLADTWTPIPGIPMGYNLADANSAMLPDGTVLQNSVYGPGSGSNNLLYDPVTDSFTVAAPCEFNDDEAAWLKLPDNSILFEATDATNTQRYIPAFKHWVADSAMPVSLYDNFGSETGPGLMLPDGRAFFLGSNGNTAYYTPSGGPSAGSWSMGPIIPRGLGTPDAPAAMMVNGHILVTLAQVPNGINTDSIFHPISYLYDFDYTTNTFTPLPAPTGGTSVNQPSCSSIMLCLPDGSVLVGIEGSNQYYVYAPDGAPLASGKPTIHTVTETSCDYMITGTLFNGNTQGAYYGDDWQMATNYPMVRLVADGKTFYARTSRWNRTGIQTGNLPDTAYFTVPVTVPNGNYALLLSANGNSSDTFNFAYTACTTEIQQPGIEKRVLRAVPNPSHWQTTLSFTSDFTIGYSINLIDIFGRQILTENSTATTGINHYTLPLQGLATGIYTATVFIGTDKLIAKIVVE